MKKIQSNLTFNNGIIFIQMSPIHPIDIMTTFASQPFPGTMTERCRTAHRGTMLDRPHQGPTRAATVTRRESEDSNSTIPLSQDASLKAKVHWADPLHTETPAPQDPGTHVGWSGLTGTHLYRTCPSEP